MKSKIFTLSFILICATTNLLAQSLDAGEIANGDQSQVPINESPNNFTSVSLATGGDGSYTYAYFLDVVYNSIPLSINMEDGFAALGVPSLGTVNQADGSFTFTDGLTFGGLGLSAGDNGTVKRVVTDGSGASATSNGIDITVIDAVAAVGDIADLENLVKMYPNPSHGSVYLTANNFDSIEIYNSVGQTVAKIKGGRDFKLNTSYFGSGIYFVKFSSPRNSVSKKLIIQ